MQNYSLTYAAAISTFAGMLGLFLNKFGYTNSDLEFILSSVVAIGGIVVQLVHRHSKGDVTALGARK